MRKIRFVIYKRERLMVVLLIIFNISLIKLFHDNDLIDSFIYKIRFLIYFFSLVAIIFSMLRNKIFFSVELNEECFIFKSILFRVTKKLSFKHINNVKIDDKYIECFFY